METTDREEEPPRKKSKKLLEQDRGQKDFSTLPYDVLVNVFKYLDLKSIGICATLCSTFNSISKDGSLYQKVTLKYNMNKEFLESFVSKISYPKELCIEYRFFDNSEPIQDYSEFNRFVRIVVTKCAEYIESIKIESCRNDDILLHLSDCVNIRELSLKRCKSTFQSLPSLTNIQNITFTCCHFPQKIVNELIKNNAGLQKLYLSDNTNVNVNEICETLSRHNDYVRHVYLGERKKLRAKSLRMLGRLTHLKSLALVFGVDSGFECDPDDFLEQIAAGCRKLEILKIYGWKEINDENLIPIIHLCTNLRELDLRALNITIRTCREAALNLPFLKTMDMFKCKRIKKSQLAKLQSEFVNIHIALE